jgi:transcriptional regulator with XRE-family HTH domain
MNLLLKYYRNLNQLESQKVADYLCMSNSAYYALERGKSKFEISKAIKLAQLYNISIEQLLNLQSPSQKSINSNEFIKLKGSVEKLESQLTKANETLDLIKNKIK